MDNNNYYTDNQGMKNLWNGFLDSISPERRFVFMRRYWFFDPVDTIAQRYHVPEIRVNAQLYFARLQLRKYLRANGYVISGVELFDSLPDIDDKYIVEAELGNLQKQ